MEISTIIDRLKDQLSKKRFSHTLRVRDTAVELAQTYGVSIERVEIAALLHDYAKERPVRELRHLILTHPLPKDLLNYSEELWHGPAGAILIENELGIKDQQILDAVCYHTTGRPFMSLIERIIFVADYIEPCRNFQGLEEIRKVAYENITQATMLVLKQTIRYLLDQKQLIYPATFYAYNDFVQQMNKEK